MKSSRYQPIIENNFIFCRKLPRHLFENKKFDEIYLVHPFDSFNTTIKKHLTAWLPVEAEIQCNVDDYVLIDTINHKTIQLRNAGSNPIFAYYVSYAFLGMILITALKTLDKNLTLKETGLYLSRDYPLKENHIQTIHTELVTSDFSEILSLFQLDVMRFVHGFASKDDYFQFLCQSPYINQTSLSHLKDSDCEYVKDFYNSIEKYKFPDDSKKLFIHDRERLFKTHFKGFSLDWFENTYKQRLDYFQKITSKTDYNFLISHLKSDFPLINGRIFGIMMSVLKEKFDNKGKFKHYIYSTSQEEIIQELKTIAKTVYESNQSNNQISA